MDVTLTTNNIPLTKPNININPAQAGSPTATQEISANKFDYSDAMMDLREVQDFLFMLIGSENPANKESKGNNVNILG